MSETMFDRALTRALAKDNDTMRVELEQLRAVAEQNWQSLKLSTEKNERLRARVAELEATLLGYSRIVGHLGEAARAALAKEEK